MITGRNADAKARAPVVATIGGSIARRRNRGCLTIVCRRDGERAVDDLAKHDVGKAGRRSRVEPDVVRSMPASRSHESSKLTLKDQSLILRRGDPCRFRSTHRTVRPNEQCRAAQVVLVSTRLGWSLAFRPRIFRLGPLETPR